MRPFGKLNRYRTVAAVQQKRGKGSLNILGAIGAPRLQGPTCVANNQTSVARMQFQIARQATEFLVAIAGMDRQVAVQVSSCQGSVRGPGIQREIGRCFNIDPYRRGMQIDMKTRLRLFLERKVDGVTALALFKRVSRKAGVFGCDMDMDSLATTAGMDVEVAVTCAEHERWLSRDGIALVPGGVALRYRGNCRQSPDGK